MDRVGEQIQSEGAAEPAPKASRTGQCGDVAFLCDAMLGGLARWLRASNKTSREPRCASGRMDARKGAAAVPDAEEGAEVRPSGDSAGRRLPGGWKVAMVALVTLAVYLANADEIGTIDALPAPYMAWSMAREANFDLDEFVPALRKFCGPVELTRYVIVYAPHSDRWISKFPPGSGIMAAPFYAVISLAVDDVPKRSRMLRAGKLVAAFYCALATGLFFAIATRLFPRARVPSTVLFAFGTTLWSSASQALWTHGPAVFWVTLAFFFLLALEGRDLKRGLLAGFALSMAVLCRPTVVVLAVPVALCVAASREKRIFGGLCLGGLAPMALLAAYNWRYTGSLLSGGYGQQAAMWDTPLWIGVLGLTVSPSRGLLWYTPAVVVSAFGALVLARRAALSPQARRVLAGGLVGSAFTILLYGRYTYWSGGWDFGSRYVAEIVPVVCLLFGLGYSCMHSRWARRGAVALVALSVGIHMLGVFVEDEGWYRRHYWAAEHDLDMFQPHDSQLVSAVRLVFSRLSGGPDEADRRPEPRPVGVEPPAGAGGGGAAQDPASPQQQQPDYSPAQSPDLPDWAHISLFQMQSARQQGVPPVLEFQLAPGVPLRLVYVPPGRFLMGSPPSEPRGFIDEERHAVEVSQGFYIGTCEVTQEQWLAVMEKNPSRAEGSTLPVERVNWHECQRFLEVLSDRSGGQFRLPTEAEWEYACRAGTDTPFWFGGSISSDVANYDARDGYTGGPKGIFRGAPVPVSSFSPNPFGLYDTHGNVWEWCQTAYEDGPSGSRDATEEPDAEGWRVLRGGAWYSDPEDLRSASRIRFPPASRAGRDGFRVVLSAGDSGED